MINKTFSFTILIMSLLFSSCYHQHTRKDWVIDSKTNVYVYRITNGEPHYGIVTAISLEHENLYFYTHDSLLMNYNDLKQKNRKEIYDNEIKDLLHYLTIKNMAKVENSGSNHCDCITKNNYVIRILKQGKEKYHIFPEVLKCDQESGLKFIEELRNAFERMSANDSNNHELNLERH